MLGRWEHKIEVDCKIGCEYVKVKLQVTTMC